MEKKGAKNIRELKKEIKPKEDIPNTYNVTPSPLADE